MYLELCRPSGKDTGARTKAIWVSAHAPHQDPPVKSTAKPRLKLDTLPSESCRGPAGLPVLDMCCSNQNHCLQKDMLMNCSTLGEESLEWVFALDINSWLLRCPWFTGEPNAKVVKGMVTSCGNDYGWIEDCVFFSTDVVIGAMTLHAGDKVLAFVEEDPLSHELKATEVRFT